MTKFLGLAIIAECIITKILFDKSVNQFWIFTLWLLIFSIVSFVVLKKIFKELKFNWRKFLKKILPGLLITLLLALLPRLFLLGIYPHVSIWDELKDGGTHALHMVNNTNSVQIFGFLSNNAWGNFIPLSAYNFFKIFGQSFLTFMVPAMIYGTLSVGLLFIILAKYKGQRFALLASVIFSVSLTQLQYSRTEIVVISDTFLALPIFIAYLLSQKHKLGYLILGLAGGLTWHFYAGARIILLCFLIIVAFKEIKKYWPSIVRRDFKPMLKRLLIITTLFFIGWFIAVGPTILFLNPRTFSSDTGNHPIIFNDRTFKSDSPIEKVGMIVNLYKEGFLSYTFYPAAKLHFFYSSSMLMFPLNFCFWIGLITILIKRKNTFNNTVLALVLLFTLFSQVVVNSIGFTHRLQAVVPFVNIIGFIGLWFLFKIFIKNVKIRNIFLTIFTAIFYLSQLFIFFGERVADIQYEKDSPKEYVFQFVLNNIATDQPGEDYYILSQAPWSYLGTKYTDKIEYLTSPKKVKVLEEKQFNIKLKDTLDQKPTTPTKFIIFKKEVGLSAESLAKLLPLTKVEYKCNQNILGILWDCPKNIDNYSYFYYEIK